MVKALKILSLSFVVLALACQQPAATVPPQSQVDAPEAAAAMVELPSESLPTDGMSGTPGPTPDIDATVDARVSSILARALQEAGRELNQSRPIRPSRIDARGSPRPVISGR